jgi:hypothetical protein
MAVPTFDVFMKDCSGKPVWLEAVTDLKAAANEASPGLLVVLCLPTLS